MTVEYVAARQTVGLSTLLKFGVGQIGAQIFRDVPATLLPLFFTTMLGVEPWLGGVAILIPKLWIILCDPLVGALSDREKKNWGRQPFLLIGGLATTIGFLALFIPPDFGVPWLYVVYIGTIFTLASTGFSLYSVPYLAIASEMTEDYHERTKVMTYRMVFTAVGLIVGVGLAQPLVLWFGGGRDGWTSMALILATICCLSMVGCYFGLRRLPLSQSFAESLPLLTQFRVASGNRPFRLLVSVHFIQQLGQASSYSAVALMFIYVIKDVALILPFIMVMSVTSLLVQPFWLSFSRRFGKKTTYIVSVVAWIFVTLSWLVAKADSDILLTVPLLGPLSTQQALVLLRALAIGIFNSGFILMSLSILTDTIDYDRRLHRMSREGIFSGVYSALEKLAFAAGPAVGGVVLSLAGFKPSTEGAVSQDVSAVNGVLAVYSILPVLFFSASLFLLARFRLNEAQLAATKFVPKA
jgi:GPH family glycoside/pentoside/hexuronide:cation symporter